MLERARDLLPTALRRRRAFVIFGQGRTGSTLLQSLLDAHPSVRCEGEILADPTADPLRHVLARRDAGRTSAYGFKVKIYQLTETQRTDPHAFLVDLVDSGFSVVYLRRTNLLRHAISNAFAESRGRYHDRDDGTRPRLTVDPAEIVGVMRRRRAHLDAEAAALEGIDHLTVTYETDLLRGERQQATADRIFELLHLPSAPVRTDLARSVPSDLRSLISNYDELAAALKGTEYEPFLTDPAYR